MKKIILSLIILVGSTTYSGGFDIIEVAKSSKNWVDRGIKNNLYNKDFSIESVKEVIDGEKGNVQNDIEFEADQGYRGIVDKVYDGVFTPNGEANKEDNNESEFNYKSKYQ